MWTEDRITEDLREMGLREGANVLAHTALHSIGPMERGADTLLGAFRRALGPTGTLMVPAFSRQNSGSVFDPAATPADKEMGYFAERVRQQPGTKRSRHPALSFAAIGPNAEFLTAHVPFHYPLGSESPLARLHQIDGHVLLIGVGQACNSSLHLAEVWANAPYIHRSTMLLTAPETETKMQGSPECSAGFTRLEPLLEQGRILHRGYVGNAESGLMRQRMAVSLAIAMLQGDACALLCDSESCAWCSRARKLCGQ